MISGPNGPASIAPRLRSNGNPIAEEQYKVAYDLQEKVVLITGAAGGIGAATARALHACGARLVLTDVTQASVDRLAAEFDAERTLALALDVTDAAATKAVVQRAVDRFGRLDIAFANAGISWHDLPATMYSCDEQEFERIVEVDLLGVWRTVKAALPEILRNRGQVLVTSSAYAFVNGMVNAPYAASKAAVEMLGRSLRAELGGTGSTANVLYPGWVATAIAKVGFGGNALATKLIEKGFPAPLRRPIQPDEVAKAVIKGLRARQPRIVVPFRWAPFSWTRGFFNIVTDWHLGRQHEMHKLMRELERCRDRQS
ncbi:MULTISPECIES: SDR family NAD(P)-dependent oxidoreductase [Burkholderia cepacia complex]|uniref:SDR family NAD(P)-dependent oxidoreductase n=1 Tax=Burkholderia cepacia complex TaxID=87882 RepID=UPI001CC6874D|nr:MULTISPECIES: SDR family NAD(P)-dependent oxidoreductase [Burkholderia cepacia complex]MDN7645835.1 SDR family oxidoreductase [Burkholderia cenocepacia]